MSCTAAATRTAARTPSESHRSPRSPRARRAAAGARLLPLPRAEGGANFSPSRLAGGAGGGLSKRPAHRSPSSSNGSHGRGRRTRSAAHRATSGDQPRQLHARGGSPSKDVLRRGLRLAPAAISLKPSKPEPGSRAAPSRRAAGQYAPDRASAARSPPRLRQLSPSTRKARRPCAGRRAAAASSTHQRIGNPGQCAGSTAGSPRRLGDPEARLGRWFARRRDQRLGLRPRARSSASSGLSASRNRRASAPPRHSRQRADGLEPSRSSVRSLGRAAATRQPGRGAQHGGTPLSPPREGRTRRRQRERGLYAPAPTPRRGVAATATLLFTPAPRTAPAHPRSGAASPPNRWADSADVSRIAILAVDPPNGRQRASRAPPLDQRRAARSGRPAPRPGRARAPAHRSAACPPGRRPPPRRESLQQSSARAPPPR